MHNNTQPDHAHRTIQHDLYVRQHSTRLDRGRNISDSLSSDALDDTMLGNRFQSEPRRTWINTNVSSLEVASDGLSPSEPSPDGDAASDAMSPSDSVSSVSRLPGAADRGMNVHPYALELS